MSDFLVSSASLFGAARGAISRVQAEMRDAQTEVTTGRHADIGLELGSRTEDVVSLREEKGRIDHQREVNATLTNRLGAIQTSLDAIFESAEMFRDTLISDPAGGTGRATIETQAQLTLDQFRAALDTRQGSNALFVEAPAEERENRIGNAGETVTTTLSRERDVFAKIEASLLALLPDGAADADPDRDPDFAARLKAARATLAEGMDALVDTRARVGADQAALERSDRALTTRSAVLNDAVADQESVDPYEAATRVTMLQNQLEASYALTARISKLSLLNYL